MAALHIRAREDQAGRTEGTISLWAGVDREEDVVLVVLAVLDLCAALGTVHLDGSQQCRGIAHTWLSILHDCPTFFGAVFAFLELAGRLDAAVELSTGLGGGSTSCQVITGVEISARQVGLASQLAR